MEENVPSLGLLLEGRKGTAGQFPRPIPWFSRTSSLPWYRGASYVAGISPCRAERSQLSGLHALRLHGASERAFLPGRREEGILPGSHTRALGPAHWRQGGLALRLAAGLPLESRGSNKLWSRPQESKCSAWWNDSVCTCCAAAANVFPPEMSLRGKQGDPCSQYYTLL